MMPNLPFASTGEMITAGLLGLGVFVGIHLVGKAASKVHPLAGAAAGIALGAGAAFGSDKLFKKNDAYAKGVAVSGIVSMLATAVSALAGMFGVNVGFAGVGSQSQVARYASNPFGAYYQAQAGLGAPNFQQAMAGSPFYQAQAGMGEYFAPVSGMGEYVSDGSLAPVSDFGEYVANRLSVEGYGDYEVQPGYAPSADGMGYVNDGVRPDANLDHEFNIMEASAGLGAASAQGRSDYVPTVQSGAVQSSESSADSGIFDVGGPNGVFG